MNTKLISIIFLFANTAILFASDNISNAKIEYLCSSKGYLKTYGTKEKCENEFYNINKKRENTKKILKKSKNTIDLVHNYVKHFGVPDSDNDKFKSYRSGNLFFTFTDMDKKDLDYNLALTNSFNILLSKSYDYTKNPYIITKEDKDSDRLIRKDLTTLKELNDFVNKFNDIQFKDKFDTYKIVDIINKKKSSLSVNKKFIQKYFELYKKIDKEKFFKDKIKISFIDTLNRFNSKSNLKISLKNVDKLLKKEKNVLYRAKLFSTAVTIRHMLKEKIPVYYGDIADSINRKLVDLIKDKGILKEDTIRDVFLVYSEFERAAGSINK